MTPEIDIVEANDLGKFWEVFKEEFRNRNK
jgi:hypothetical protein